MKLNILHICVHFGGGVGTVVRKWLEKDQINTHTILALNENYAGEEMPNVHERMRWKYDEINEFVEKADVVIVHFWNHPMLFEFLINANLPASRLCIWSHVSCLDGPYVHTNKMVDFSDRFILSSDISNISQIDSSLQDRIDVIWTTGGIDDYLKLKLTPTEKFVVGYVGTLDYAKICLNFIDLCRKISIKIPNVKFTICGSGCDMEIMQKEVTRRKLDHLFEFTGIVDIKKVMPTFNTFGYPLNRKHFGTCEQVLGEIMALGIEPVVLNNPAEHYIVNGVGRVCDDFDSYVNNIVDIYKNPTDLSKRRKLKERSICLYSLDILMSRWSVVFEELMDQPKKTRLWKDPPEERDGYNIFIESIGPYGEIIQRGIVSEIVELFDSNNQWKSQNKGSVFQYLQNFPDDKRLQELAEDAKFWLTH